jgi:hypothetical protein
MTCELLVTALTGLAISAAVTMLKASERRSRVSDSLLRRKLQPEFKMRDTDN